MLANQPNRTSYETFRDALLGAVVDGRFPPATCDLGPQSSAVIRSIAERHPEADPDLIADAYDAFDSEHGSDGWRLSVRVPNC